MKLLGDYLDFYQGRYNSAQGFSLIELIVVIVIIAVLGVSAYAKFSGTAGYTDYTYQARLISALRSMQMRAMHDTRNDRCYQLNLIASPPQFGPPTSSELATCTLTSNIDYNRDDFLRVDSPQQMTTDNVSLTAEDSGVAYEYIRFDALGRPSTAGPSCAPCTLTISGEETLQICVESEGYIHAC